MRTATGEITPPYTSSEARDMIAERVGYAISQPRFSQWLAAGYIVASATFASYPAFTEEDMLYNLRWVWKNYNAEAGEISRRRNKLKAAGRPETGVGDPQP